jgi:TolB-like protein/Tfp pilus assembly protein PilF
MEIWAVSNPGLAVPDPSAMASRPSQGRTSVAVLPFVNMSSHAENEFFSDGVTEELINALTRINGLHVTARTSSFAFKGLQKDVRSIAEELGVATVLEGSVRRAGDRVRITAQLIDATDGYHLFSKSYDRKILDLFQTQDEIAETIAAELKDRFDPEPSAVQGEHEPPASVSGRDEPRQGGEGWRPPSRPLRTRHAEHFHDAEAYTEFLKGIHKFNQWTPEGARGALRHFQRSIELDPTCALPHSGIANAYTFLAALGQMPGDVAYARAKKAAERGLELEEGVAEAHAALATVLFFHDWDFQGAYRHFQKALTLTPGSASLRRLYAMYLSAMGDFHAAEDELLSALESDPLSGVVRTALGEVLLKSGRGAEAREHFAAVLELDPEFRAARELLGWAHLSDGDAGEALREWEELAKRTYDPFKVIPHRIWALTALGRTDEARKLLLLLRERREREPEIALEVDFALAHLGLGDHESALDYLERAVDRRLGAVVFLNVIPPLQRLRSHPRFQAMVERIGIPGPAKESQP